MAGILTFQATIAATGTAQQIPSQLNQGKPLTLSAPSGNTADIVISTSATTTNGFILPKGTSVSISGLTNTNSLWVSGTAADKVSGMSAN